MTVIDLGERRDTPAPADPGSRRFLRRWAPALVALLCLVAPTAAAPWPTQPTGTTIPANLDAHLLPVADLLLVADQTGPGADPAPRLVAHRLPSGRPLWRVPVPGPGTPFRAVRHGDLLVLGLVGEQTEEQQVVGLSAADGGVRWRMDGLLRGLTPAGNLLVWRLAETGPPILLSIDAASGAVRWSRQLSVETVRESRRDARVSLLAVLDGGRLELRDPDTGAVVRAAALPVAATPPEVLALTDDLVVLSDGPGGVAAYEVATLRRRWTLSRGPADRVDVSDCGAALCLDDGSPGPRLLDPATGSTRWRADGWTLLESVGNWLLALSDVTGPIDELALLDALTGRPVRHLGRWQPLSGARWGDGSIVRRRQRDGRVLFGRLDDRGEGVRVLAALRGAVGECDMHGVFLVCRRDGGAGVWELPDAR